MVEIEKPMKPLRVTFIGWGAINSRVGALLKERTASVDIVAVATRTRSRTAIPAGASFLQHPDELATLKPDLVVEAAGRAAVEAWAPQALRHARALIVASTSAFCDDALLARLRKTARAHGSRILIPSGAIGAIDALAAASILPIKEVMHRIAKSPKAWKGTEAEQLVDLDGLRERRVFFVGSAREAAARFPQNANATVVTSLAGVGLDRTRVELTADPSIGRNQHTIRADGDFGAFEITLHNEPSKTNPKTSEMTALSIVHLLERQFADLVI
jgi:aspartate dehydrogenase